MRRTLLVLCVLALAAATACAPAASVPAPDPGPWAADSARIVAALQESADAWNRADLPGHLAIYTDSSPS